MKRDKDKTKEQLLNELKEMRRRVDELEASEAERKQAEEALRESEERYRILLEETPLGIMSVDIKGKITYVNNTILEVTGYSIDDLVGKNAFRLGLVSSETLSLLRRRLGEKLMGEPPSPLIIQFKCKDGEWIWLEIRGKVLRKHVMPIGVQIIGEDITERKRAEEKLRESEERLTNFMNSATEAFIILDSKLNYLDANQKYLDLVRLKKDEIIGKNAQYVSPDVKESGRYDMYMEVIRTGAPLFLEDIIPHPSFGNLHLLVKGFKLMDGIGFIMEDITERKQVEKALKESEEIYRSLINDVLDSSAVGMFILDSDFKVVWVNRALERYFGIRRDDIIGADKRNLIRDRVKYIFEDPEGFAQTVLATYDNNTYVENFECHALADGEHQERWLEHWSQPITTGLYAGGRIEHYTDITERKRQERQREFNHRLLEISNLGRQLAPTLRQFVQAIKDYTSCAAVGIRILDSEGNIPYEAYEGFSRKFYESESPLSIKSDQCMCINVIKGDTGLGLPFYTEDGSFYMNGTTAFLATVSEEEKGSTRNVCNEQGYESVALVPIRLGADILGLIHVADKKTDMVPLELVNTLEDLAPQIGLAIRRLWAEHELAEEKERLEVTLRSTGDGIISVDMEGKVVLLNRAAEEMTGWTQKEAVGRAIREVFNIIDERNRQPVPNPVENVLKTGRIIGLVDHAILISRDGTERLIADSGAPIHDEQGRMFGVVLVFRDITESHRLQEEQARVAKLESVGTLAGGIAHDFNNLLTGIMGNIGLAKRHMKPEDKAFERLEEAEKAAVRARDLTQQLLTFAQGGMPVKNLASISELIRETATFALRGSKTGLKFSLPDDLWAAEVDEGQISQAIYNIVINADDAMPSGGGTSHQRE